jgi:hypothetical protein
MNRDWATDKPNMFKREFSVARTRCIYKDGREAEFNWGIKSAMRKIGARLGLERG